MTRRLVLPDHILQATAHFFRPYAEAGVECPAIWHGIEGEDTDTVTTVTIPDAERHPARYVIPEEATAAMGAKARSLGLVALAQVHTHPPGCSVRHSPWDDSHALSLGDAFLSLVVPNYGAKPFTISEAGVHEVQNGRWLFLKAAEKLQRISVVPAELDLREFP